MKKGFFYLLFAINLVVVFYFWWTGGSGALWQVNGDSRLIALGRLAGLLGQLLLLVQLALIGRLGPLERTFGMDKLMRPHRYLGYGLLGLFIIHPLFLSLGYAGAQSGAGAAVQQFGKFVWEWDEVWQAFLAFIIFVAVVFASLPPLRRRLRYERWYAFHLLIYVAIILVFGHQTEAGDLAHGPGLYYWFLLNFSVFGVYLTYRFLRPLWLFYRHRFTVTRVATETSDVHSVYLEARELSRFPWQAGQFANVYFLQRGFGWSHPFSFSLPPSSQQLRFSIKAIGDFTSRIGRLRPGTKAIIDGPLGIFTAAQAKQNKFLLIAGGIGITPLRSLAEELISDHKDVALIYAAKTEDDFALRGELEQLRGLQGHYLPGHLNFDAIKALVPDYRERAIYVCGPKGMMQALVKNFIANGVAKTQLHFERFEY